MIKMNSSEEITWTFCFTYDDIILPVPGYNRRCTICDKRFHNASTKDLIMHTKNHSDKEKMIIILPIFVKQYKDYLMTEQAK